MKPVNRWLEWLLSRERRKATRQEAPELVAHYWDGAAPMAHDVRDISSTGLYLLTEQRWYPGTLVKISLQRNGVTDTDPDHSITVSGKVVRSGADGVGLSLVLPEKHSAHGHLAGGNGADRRTFLSFLKRFLAKPAENQGQALIEYALILPLVFLLIVNVVNFGGFFYAFIAVTNAARAGADYAILGGPSAGSPVQGTVTTINTLIQTDISSLPNKSSLSVNICQSNNGSVTPVVGTCSSIPADPEDVSGAPVASYVLTSVDVTYTYIPFIPLFSAFGVNATIPPTTVHRRAVMRSYQ
jgi:Flp pilus assembly protein TadG